MSLTRAELHELVDRLPDEKVGPLLRLVQCELGDQPIARDLPFIGMLAAEPDFAERSEEILHAEDNRFL
ncbi:hypothetical protein ITP53_07730 [Nonomuraea sp. K274]|uniref:Uncharacterized protein n=1 Tax=Nonomuraea cypriaca TaxID=1187855 RepID=A0A931A7W8_9ACTN|nr:hypothetical protein [Nonomuraea cypriaca]MBF8185628.1 hypothetical protein [Nonomuraea cypriaca]